MENITRRLLELAKLMLTACEDYKVPDSAFYAKQLEKFQKEFHDEAIRRKTGEEAGKYMENFVNIMSNREQNQKFAEYIVCGTHRTLNQSLIGLFVQVMIEEAKLYPIQRFDGRNKAAVEFCHSILPQLEESYLPLI